MTVQVSRVSLVMRSLLAATWFSLWFFVFFPALVLWWTGAKFPPVPGPRVALGLSVILLAHYVLMQHLAAFVSVGGGTQAPFDPPRRLVVRGLYRRMRNPMYLIYVTIIGGEALVFGSWWVLVYALLVWCLAHAYVVRLQWT